MQIAAIAAVAIVGTQPNAINAPMDKTPAVEVAEARAQRAVGQAEASEQRAIRDDAAAAAMFAARVQETPTVHDARVQLHAFDRLELVKEGFEHLRELFEAIREQSAAEFGLTGEGASEGVEGEGLDIRL